MPWLVTLKNPYSEQALTMEVEAETGSERSMMGMMDKKVLCFGDFIRGIWCCSIVGFATKTTMVFFFFSCFFFFLLSFEGDTEEKAGRSELHVRGKGFYEIFIAMKGSEKRALERRDRYN